MNERRFRALISVYLVAYAASIATALTPGLVPAPLKQALLELPDPLESKLALLVMVFAIPLIIAVIASMIGLFVFASWARPLALWTTVAELFTYPFLGPVVMPGLAAALHDVSAMLWGAILAVAYFSPIRGRFSRMRTEAS